MSFYELRMTHENGSEVLRIRLAQDGDEWHVECVVDKGYSGEIGVYARTFRDRSDHNIMGVLYSAMYVLSEENYETMRGSVNEAPVPSNLARRQLRGVSEVQTRFSRLCNYRPPFRRR